MPLPLRLSRVDSAAWKAGVKSRLLLSAASSGSGVLLITLAQCGATVALIVQVSLSTQFNPPTAMNVDCDLLRKNLCPRRGRSRCVLLVSCLSNFWSHGWRWWLAIGYNQRSMVLIFNSKLTDSVECSLKQPRSSEFCWPYSICEDLEGWETETSRVAAVTHFMHFKPFLKNKEEERDSLQPRVWQTSTSLCEREGSVFSLN